MDMDTKTLSNRVKELCTEQGITLKELSEKMGIKPESLSRALNGNPQLSTLENIAKALGVGVVDDGKTYLFHSKSGLKDWLNQWLLFLMKSRASLVKYCSGR